MNLKRYIPNLITMSRIVMTVIFVRYIILQFGYGQDLTKELVILYLGICISDFLDGKIARKINYASNLGAKLDVFADLLYIVLSYIALINVKIMPMWFLGFILLKFSEFIITSKFIQSNKSGNAPFIFDKVGRIVSSTFLIIPGVVCFHEVLNSFNIKIIFNCLLYVLLAAGIYSSYKRIKSCMAIYKLKNN